MACQQPDPLLLFLTLSSGGVTYSGWYIDDVSIIENLNNDVAVRSIDAPTGEIDVNLSPIVPRVTVYNAGTQSQSFETETIITVDNIEEYVSRKMTYDLSPYTNTVLEFDPWEPGKSSGNAKISTKTILMGDEDISNDTLSVKYKIINKPFSITTSLSGLDTVDAESFAWGDYNNDGDLDLFILIRYFSSSDPYLPGILFRNDGGDFIDVSNEAGFKPIEPLVPSYHIHPSSSIWLDYNNDGYLDLYVGIWDSPNHLYQNNGDGTFKDMAGDAGVDLGGQQSAISADYDNDGFTDLLMWNKSTRSDILLYRNTGNGTFREFSTNAGLANQIWVYRAIFGDYDNDGDLDLFATGNSNAPGILYRNNCNNQHNWLIVKTEGNQSNTQWYGARIKIKTGDLIQIRQINGGTINNPNSLPAEFGLGTANSVDTLEIRWPSGIVDTATNIIANQILTVEEGKGITGIQNENVLPFKPTIFSLDQNYPNPFNPETNISFQIPEAGHVKLTIYNLFGQEVITLIDEKRDKGKFVELWNSKDMFGKSVSSGIYIYRLDAGRFVANRKLLLLR